MKVKRVDTPGAIDYIYDKFNLKYTL